MTNLPEFDTGTIWTDDLREIARRLEVEIVALRRHLHTHPELSMQEISTTRYLATRVAALGLAPHITERGVGLTCDWQSASQGTVRRIGLRGDIDALPILTTSNSAYASQVRGVMHACGHDAHASMVWGALAILIRMEERRLLPWPVAVRAIFQPAEETSEGGPLMVASGALEGLDSVLALHVDPTLAVGTVAARPGPFTAACDTFDVDFIGRGGHSARPHLSTDAIAAASAWVGELYARVPRVHDCRDPAVVSVGAIHAGNAPNVVAGFAQLSGTIRTFSEQVRGAIQQEMHTLCEATECKFACQTKLSFSAYTPSLHNDPRLNQVLTHTAHKLRDIESVGSIERPSMGAEDFAFFAQHKPACMLRLGVAGDHRGSHALHTPEFDVDERALTIGAQLLAAASIELSREDPPAGEWPH